jgi:hypothetical protein
MNYVTVTLASFEAYHIVIIKAIPKSSCKKSSLQKQSLQNKTCGEFWVPNILRIQAKRN